MMENGQAWPGCYRGLCSHYYFEFLLLHMIRYVVDCDHVVMLEFDLSLYLHGTHVMRINVCYSIILLYLEIM